MVAKEPSALGVEVEVQAPAIATATSSSATPANSIAVAEDDLAVEKSKATTDAVEGPKADAAPVSPPRNLEHAEAKAQQQRPLSLGLGYDLLSGKRRGACTTAPEVGEDFRTIPLNQTYETLDLVASPAALRQALDLDVDAGLFQQVSDTGQHGSRGEIYRQAHFDSKKAYAIASFRVLRDEISLVKAQADLTLASKKLLADRDVEAFREQCGDAYIAKIHTGAQIFLVLEIQRPIVRESDLFTNRSALQMALGQLLGQAQGQLTAAERESLKGARVSSRCFVEGARPEICADFGLSLENVDLLSGALAQPIAHAKKALAVDVLEHNLSTIVAASKVAYAMPEPLGEGVDAIAFLPTAKESAALRGWLDMEDRVTRICRFLRHIEDDCAHALAQITSGAFTCTTPATLEDCHRPSDEDFAAILEFGQGGSITLWEHGKGARRDQEAHGFGRSLTLDFEDLLSPDSMLLPDVIYSLHSEVFENFGDIISTMDHQLKNGWRLVLFEHPDGTGRSNAVSQLDDEHVDVRRGFNDRASAFRLERLIP